METQSDDQKSRDSEKPYEPSYLKRLNSKPMNDRMGQSFVIPNWRIFAKGRLGNLGNSDQSQPTPPPQTPKTDGNDNKAGT